LRLQHLPVQKIDFKFITLLYKRLFVFCIRAIIFVSKEGILIQKRTIKGIKTMPKGFLVINNNALISCKPLIS